jgi:hypothetical protein
MATTKECKKCKTTKPSEQVIDGITYKAFVGKLCRLCYNESRRVPPTQAISVKISSAPSDAKLPNSENDASVKLCTVDKCNQPVAASRSICQTHYNESRRLGAKKRNDDLLALVAEVKALTARVAALENPEIV